MTTLPHWGRGIRKEEGKHDEDLCIPLPRLGGEGRVRGPPDAIDPFMNRGARPK